jgi:hypothetical protein
MSEVTAPVTPTVQIDVAAELAKALALRDQIKAAEDAFKERIAPYKAALKEMEIRMQRFLSDTKQDSCTVRGVGVVYKTTKHSFTIDDHAAFRRAVIGAELWDFVDWKVNATLGKETVENEARAAEAKAKGEPVEWNGPHLPDGVKHTTFDTVGLRKQAGKKGD